MKMRIGSTARLFAPALALAAILSLSVGRCEADLLLRVEQPAAAEPGGSGAFDVYLEVLSGSYDVSAFSFGLKVAPGSGVAFTGADAASASAPYIFASLSWDGIAVVVTASSLIAGDSPWVAPGSVTLAAGDVVGLGRVTYAVAAGTPAGAVALSFLLGGETEILDDLGAPLAFDAAPAEITIDSTGVVPEPSSLALLALALAAAPLAAARRRAG